jgi:transcriptional regulator of heat shock response
MSPDQLTARQKSLLYAVVKEYCENNESVGSSELKERYNFEFSSATIRNELMVLREMGYLYQPFKNSGSVPTEISLKLFINRLLEGLETSSKQQQNLRLKIVELQNKQTVLSQEIAKFLAEQGGGVGFALSDSGSNIKGMGNLLKHGAQGTVSDILEFLENLDTYKKYLLPSNSAVDVTSTPKPVLQMIMGDDNPVIPLGKGYGLVSTEVELKTGEKSVVGLITPLSMLGQQKNLELLGALNTLLNPKTNTKK